MINFIDDFLNRITMYRLVLYYLISLILVAIFFSLIHVLKFDPIALSATTLFLVFFGGFVNDALASFFKAPTNVESIYISALILSLIVKPVQTTADFMYLSLLVVIMVASKFILAINKKHIFNPVAIALVVATFIFNQSASWWVGNTIMAPFVLIGGLLVVRKIRREGLVYSFFIVAVSVLLIFNLSSTHSIFDTLNRIFLHSSLLFFAFVMLTEPLTSPPTKQLQIVYGMLTGFLFVPQVHIGAIYSTPELALITGNLFSYLVSPKYRLMLNLKQKIQLSPDTYEFIFPSIKNFSYTPGQYMEWTLPHTQVDSRGNRRYFTLASSPTEDNLRIGVKFYTNSSSYKRNLFNLNPVTSITASQTAGDFVLSKKKQEKYVFVAGGIGITPFRSILKYLMDTQNKQDITLLYSNKNSSEIVYQDIIDEAVQKLGIKVVYTLTDTSAIDPGWQGYRGRISVEMIQKEIPDFRERLFYISGPHALVTGFEEVLHRMGIRQDRIKVDFFPGFT